MKIAYVASVAVNSYGVHKKVRNQSEIWKKNGHQVDIFWVAEQCPPSNPKFTLWKRFNVLNPRFSLLRSLWQYKPDLIYFREEAFSIFVVLFTVLFRRKIVMEINSRAKTEQILYVNSTLKKILYNIGCFIQPCIIKSIAGCVFVSHELALQPEFAKQSRKHITANSIYLEENRLQKNISANDSDDTVQIFFGGSKNQPWHGVNKIPHLAKKLGNKFVFHIVGPSMQDVYGETTPLENIILYDYMKQDDYLTLLAKSHIAISTLALHRNNMHEASPLKLREYLAMGIPSIVAYTETSLKDISVPWLLQIANVEHVFESEETIENIRKFCLKNKNLVIPEEEVRPYIDSEILEKNKIMTIKSWV